MIKLNEVVSSNIKGIGFDEGIIVEYKSGARYKYKGTTKELYEELVKADSKGSFIARNIRNNYEFEKIDVK